jgi:hypothetical protein
MKPEITVACVKAKPNYGHEYVNRLHRAVREHFPVRHRFVCFTDDASGVMCNTKGLPQGIGGWWAKLALFRDGVLKDRVIYFDLDTLVVDDISFLAEYEGSFALLRDFYRPDGYGSGVMVWNGEHSYIWNKWVAAGRPLHPLGDQGWMEQQVKAELLQELYPGAFKSFKADELEDGPKGAAVVSFHGVPKQHDFADDHWVSKAWNPKLKAVA